MEKTLLLVDDEASLLRELQDVLGPLGHRLLLAESAEQGLAAIAEEPVDLVIADMIMPEMNGHQFLKQVRQKRPATMRAILSTFAEGKDVVNALRDGSARLYVLRPWDNAKLIEAITKLLQLGELFSNRKLLEVFNNLQDLPTMPEMYARLCEMIENEAGLDEIARLIEQDQTVSVKVLQVANSVYFGMNTGSIRQAIVFMGLANTKTIVLGLSVMKQLNGLQGGFFSKDVLWDHADRVNRLTHIIFEKCLRRPMKESEETAGLLHDIGRVLLLKDFNPSYAGISRSVFQNKETSLRDAERSLMGISHDEVGGFLLNWWSLPHPIVETAMFHHDPMNAAVVHRELVAAVHVADYYAWKQKKAIAMPKLCPEVFDVLGVDGEECEKLFAKI